MDPPGRLSFYMENVVLLSTAYFAPIQYYCKIFEYNSICIEHWENFPKQTYRNRSVIYGANGLLNLTVPVEKGRSQKTITKDIRIDYATNWQTNHIKSIQSAYRHSPFYEFFEEDINRIISKKYKYLIDLNYKTLEMTFDWMEISPKIKATSEFSPTQNENDFRFSISPKPCHQEEDLTFAPIEYYQVFKEKLGFKPNLSIIDLLCNEGPNAYSIIEASIIIS